MCIQYIQQLGAQVLELPPCMRTHLHIHKDEVCTTQGVQEQILDQPCTHASVSTQTVECCSVLM